MGFAASGGNATKQLAAVRGVGPRRVSSSRRRHRRDPRGLAPPWGTGMRRGSRQTQRPASEPPGPTVAADDAPTSCLGDNGTASLPWALSTATCSAQVRRPASRPSFPTPSQPQRPTPRCRQICAGTTSSCSNFPGGSVHFRLFPLEKISPAPGNRIRSCLCAFLRWPAGCGRHRRTRQRERGGRDALGGIGRVDVGTVCFPGSTCCLYGPGTARRNQEVALGGATSRTPGSQRALSRQFLS